MSVEGPVVIATAATEDQAAVIRALLMADGIPTYDRGGVGYGVYGVGTHVQIVVAPSDADRALEVLRREGMDPQRDFSPDQKLITEMNRFWPRGNPGVRMLAILWFAWLAVALALSLLPSRFFSR